MEFSYKVLIFRRTFVCEIINIRINLCLHILKCNNIIQYIGVDAKRHGR